MRKGVAFLLVVLIVVCLGIWVFHGIFSGSVPTAGEGVADPAPWRQNTNGYRSNQVFFDLEPGYHFDSVDWLGREELLIVAVKDWGSSSGAGEYRKVYAYNILDDRRTLLFEGEFGKNPGGSRVVLPRSGQAGLQAGDRLLLFDLQKGCLQKNLPFPSGALEAEVSGDGRSLVYLTSEGLFRADLDDHEPQLLADVQKALDVVNPLPVRPHWSDDNQRIAYVTRLGDEARVNIITTGDGKLEQHAIPGGDEFDLLWLPDNGRLLVASGNRENRQADLTVIFTPGGGQESTREDGTIALQEAFGDMALYSCTNRETDRVGLVLFNCATGQGQALTPQFSDVLSARFSPTGRFIAFLARNGGDPELYITYKDTNPEGVRQ